MATIESILAKIVELEHRCPGTHIHRNNLEALASNDPLVCGSFRLDTPATSGRIATFRVDLAEMNETMDQWLDNEIPRHTPTTYDNRYNVICPKHGRVQIGQSLYRHQMALADKPWICPLCGAVSEFDDETYEAGFYEEAVNKEFGYE
jgi:hypothetical protein